jgi:hypothetical protein
MLLDSKGHFWSVVLKGDDATPSDSVWDDVGQQTDEEAGGERQPIPTHQFFS